MPVVDAAMVPDGGVDAGIGMTLRTAKYRPAAYVRKVPPPSQKSRIFCGRRSVPVKARSGKSVNVEGAAPRQRAGRGPRGVRTVLLTDRTPRGPRPVSYTSPCFNAKEA